MQLQTTSSESKFPNEYTDVIFIQIDQHLKKLLPKYKGVPILWNTVYLLSLNCTELEALGQCIPPPVSRYGYGSGSPPKFNHLFTGPLPTFPGNFMQMHLEVFAQSC